MLQNTPMSRFRSTSRRMTLTHLNRSRLSIIGMMPAVSATSMYDDGMMTSPAGSRSRVRAS